MDLKKFIAKHYHPFKNNIFTNITMTKSKYNNINKEFGGFICNKSDTITIKDLKTFSNVKVKCLTTEPNIDKVFSKYGVPDILLKKYAILMYILYSDKYYSDKFIEYLTKDFTLSLAIHKNNNEQWALNFKPYTLNDLVLKEVIILTDDSIAVNEDYIESNPSLTYDVYNTNIGFYFTIKNNPGCVIELVCFKDHNFFSSINSEEEPIVYLYKLFD